MPLTHVCMWAEHSWKPITVEEAAKLHPGGTVSARSGLFMCGLCRQYVTLTDGDIRNRYFKHSSEEKSKDCPERTFGPAVSTTFQESSHGLPLRLVISSPDKFELQLGLIPVPESILGSRENQQIKISFPEEGNNGYHYSLTRIQEGVTTYLSIGSVPYATYCLDISPTNNILTTYWPQKIDGIPREGALFDGISGKKLPDDADVQVNHQYYLLTSKLVLDCPFGIVSKKICRCQVGYYSWNVYSIKATLFYESAAKFFLGYRCRLTENAVSIIPLWPAYIETPYLIRHHSDTAFFFLRGDAVPKTFPFAEMRPYKCKEDGVAFSVDCRERQQLLSAGRIKVLQYTYLWKDPLDKQEKLPTAAVTDITGAELLSGEYDHLPKKKTLIIHTPFDGYAEVKRQDVVIERYSIQAGENAVVDGLQMGQAINIYQGLDLVWSAQYKKGVANNRNQDNTLYTRLSSCSGSKVEISHSIGAIATRMGDYPLSKEWLYKQIRSGAISETALRVLISHFSEQ